MKFGKGSSTPCALRELLQPSRCEEFCGGICEISIDGQRTQGGQIESVTLQEAQVHIICSMFVTKEVNGKWTLQQRHPTIITPRSVWRCGNDLILEEEVPGSTTLTVLLRISCERMLTLVKQKT